MRSLLIACIAASLAAQFAPPPAYQPSEAEKQQIRDRMAVLAPLLKAPIPFFCRTWRSTTRQPIGFFDTANSTTSPTLRIPGGPGSRHRTYTAVAPRGALVGRAEGRLVRAYRSRVDASVQPYGLAIPESYDGTRPVRLDVVLHGRGATLNEVSFIAAHDSANPIPAEQDFIQLDVFGRTNNAYRWAGETDVFEALDRCASATGSIRIASRFVVFRWGARALAHWSALPRSVGGHRGGGRFRRDQNLREAVGAARTSGIRLAYLARRRGLPLNLFDVPSVGYGGEEDPQLKASETMQERAALEGLERISVRCSW